VAAHALREYNSHALTSLNKQIEKLDAALEKTANQNEKVVLLTSVPSVGPVTAEHDEAQTVVPHD
jgi:transposase